MLVISLQFYNHVLFSTKLCIDEDHWVDDLLEIGGDQEGGG